jgi:hypothetical protein
LNSAEFCVNESRYCINPSTRERTLLTPADTKFFALLAKYDCHVPVVIALTKSDRIQENDERLEYLTKYTELFGELLRRVVEPIFVSKCEPTNA